MIYNKEVSSKIAEYLLEIKAVKFNVENPFVWASGMKSPIYCDNRLTLSFTEVRNFIKTAFAQAIKDKFPETNAIAGVATAGIAHGALVADEMDLPMLYVRSKAKGHGLQNMIEGKVDKSSNIFVVEDLISTGGSSLAAVEALREAGYNVIGLAAICTYQFQVATDNFSNARCPYFTLSQYDELLTAAVKMKYIDDNQLEMLKEWKQDPKAWEAKFIS